MKKSVNLTLTTDEIKEAILNYLKGKDIYIPSPEDANIELGEDDYNAYAIVSYSKDVDIDKHDKVIKELTPNSPEEKQRVEDESPASVDENPDDGDDGRKDPIKEILDIDSQPLPIRKVYFYLRSINYFDRKVAMDIISKDKDTINNTIDLMKRIAHTDVEKM